MSGTWKTSSISRARPVEFVLNIRERVDGFQDSIRCPCSRCQRLPPAVFRGGGTGRLAPRTIARQGNPDVCVQPRGPRLTVNFSWSVVAPDSNVACTPSPGMTVALSRRRPNKSTMTVCPASCHAVVSSRSLGIGSNGGSLGSSVATGKPTERVHRDPSLRHPLHVRTSPSHRPRGIDLRPWAQAHSIVRTCRRQRALRCAEGWWNETFFLSGTAHRDGVDHAVRGKPLARHRKVRTAPIGP